MNQKNFQKFLQNNPEMRGVENLGEKIEVFNNLLELRDKFRSAEVDQRSAIAWQIAWILHRESVDSYQESRSNRKPLASVGVFIGTLDSGHNLLELYAEFFDEDGNYLVGYTEPFFSNDDEEEFNLLRLSCQKEESFGDPEEEDLSGFAGFFTEEIRRKIVY